MVPTIRRLAVPYILLTALALAGSLAGLFVGLSASPVAGILLGAVVAIVPTATSAIALLSRRGGTLRARLLGVGLIAFMLPVAPISIGATFVRLGGCIALGESKLCLWDSTKQLESAEAAALFEKEKLHLILASLQIPWSHREEIVEGLAKGKTQAAAEPMRRMRACANALADTVRSLNDKGWTEITALQIDAISIQTWADVLASTEHGASSAIVSAAMQAARNLRGEARNVVQSALKTAAASPLKKADETSLLENLRCIDSTNAAAMRILTLSVGYALVPDEVKSVITLHELVGSRAAIPHIRYERGRTDGDLGKETSQ